MKKLTVEVIIDVDEDYDTSETFQEELNQVCKWITTGKDACYNSYDLGEEGKEYIITNFKIIEE